MVNGGGIMFLAYPLLYLFALLTSIHTRGGWSFCFDSNSEGFRLNATIFKSEVASGQVDCVMKCVKEACCRSVNYKTTLNSENETNCEMLHDVVYNSRAEEFEKNSSYDYVFLLEPVKEYNASCYPKVSEEHSQADHISDSEILSNEPQLFHEKLIQWLPAEIQLRTNDCIVCWRASRDGWTSSAFHSRCDNKKPTITIVKVVKHTKVYIFGGYATATWTATGNGNYKSAPGSFLFSLRNNDDIPPFKLIVKNHLNSYAIYARYVFGPTFGEKDLFISHSANANEESYAELGKVYQLPSGYIFQQQKTRELLAGSLTFSPSEVEVLHFPDAGPKK